MSSRSARRNISCKNEVDNLRNYKFYSIDTHRCVINRQANQQIRKDNCNCHYEGDKEAIEYIVLYEISFPRLKLPGRHNNRLQQGHMCRIEVHRKVRFIRMGNAIFFVRLVYQIPRVFIECEGKCEYTNRIENHHFHEIDQNALE